MHKIFSVQDTQKFEYFLSHVHDKAVESLFGFIHVLPGAFSGYRWEAIKHRPDVMEQHQQVLNKYLKTQTTPNYIFKKLESENMAQAEDRVMNLAIYVQP